MTDRDKAKGLEAFINRVYHEIKAQWNLRRQMPDASDAELTFFADLLDKFEADDYEAASDMRDYCERYEPTYNPDDGSM